MVIYKIRFTFKIIWLLNLLFIALEFPISLILFFENSYRIFYTKLVTRHYD